MAINILRYIVLVLCFYPLSVSPVAGQFYNGSQTGFGKNRVQYRDFFWYFYRYHDFNVYFYTGEKDAADYIARSTDSVINELERFFDYSLDEKIFFIVYNNISDLQQSNIGFITDQMHNTGGITRVVGTKVFVHHDGSFTNLQNQLRLGIAETILNQMMFGGSIKDRLKSSTLLSLPDWYSNGLVSYAAHGWNTGMDNFIKDGVKSGKIRKFNHLSGSDATLAGHAIWNYVAERYGPSVIPGILYMTKLSRNIESGFLFVLGTSINTLTYECLDYYLARADADDMNRSAPAEEPILVKSGRGASYHNFQRSPDNQFAVYTSNMSGRYKITLLNMASGKSTVIKKGGYKKDGLIEYSYPLVAWHPSKPLLTAIFAKKGKVWIQYFDVTPGKQKPKNSPRPIHHLNKVHGFSYSPDGNKLVLSAVKGSQNDIFIYGISSNNIDQVTNDMYDDRYPSFSSDGREIIFSSNRVSDTLMPMTMSHLTDSMVIKPVNPLHDVFIYDAGGGSPVLKRLTRTENADEIYPYEYGYNHYAFLSDYNGILNRYIVSRDSVISHIDTIAHYRYVTSTFPVTNYRRDIIYQHILSRADQVDETVYEDDEYRFYSFGKRDEKELPVLKPSPTLYRISSEKAIKKKMESKPDTLGSKKSGKKNESLEILFLEDTAAVKPVEVSNQQTPPAEKIDVDHYVFDSELKKNTTGRPVPDEKAGTMTPTDTLEYVHPARFSRQWVYRPAFITDYLVTQLDNSYMEGSYQKFAANTAVYTNPGLNGLIKIGISDILEDYRITGGFRFSGDMQNNEYMMSFEFLKDRLDKKLTFHRQSLLQYVDYFYVMRIQTHEVKGEVSWPFTEILSLKGSVIARNDHMTTLSTEAPGLVAPSRSENLAGLKSQLIYDNTRSRGLNLYNGTRMKFFTEAYKQIEKDKTWMYVTGIDVRHYLPIHRDFIWANRLAAGTSFGQQKLIFYLGGVDGWIKPQFDKSHYIDPAQNYGYQTLVTNMRGFHQNVRNGNSFAVINSELRLPVIRYLYPNPIRSDFLYNLQMIAFTDIGTAWTGLHPYSEDNSLNLEIIDKSPAYIIRITQDKEPVVGGFGFGIRSRIWGYFVRVDWARGIEQNVLLDRIWYISLSTDF